jgi:hypothetical protein
MITHTDTTLTFIHITVKEQVTLCATINLDSLTNIHIRFLRSPSSNLVLSYEDLILEHGVALITHLRAGLQVFSKTTARHSQIMRVVTGLDGFQLYASDHWIDYLFAATGIVLKTLSELRLYQLAVDLAKQVEYIGENISLLQNKETSSIADDRLEPLPDVKLRQLVRLTLESRSPKFLEVQLFLPAGELTHACIIVP